MQKSITIFSILILMLALSTSSFAQLFSDDFESGTASPDWGVYRAGEENVTAVTMATAPEPLANGGNYIGLVQDIDASYSGASIILAGATSLQNYSIEGDVYCYTNDPGGSAYTGLAVYSDSALGTYIKLAADFDPIPEPRFRLYNNRLDMTTFEYTFYHEFIADSVPGGIPTVDGWHHMKVEVRTINDTTTAFWCYFDGQMLLGCPIYDTGVDQMDSGQFGLYSFQMDGVDGIPGYFDNIVVNDLTTSVEDNSNGSLPEEFALEQNYPNPFNPSTRISYKLSTGNHVSLTIHDLLGRKIKTLVSGFQSAGHYSVEWNGKDELGNTVPSGVYLYSLHSGGYVISKKMMLMK
jgi:hypothetical protein